MFTINLSKLDVINKVWDEIIACLIPFFIAEEDFSTVIKILEFHSGNMHIDVNISIINDESIEGNETFTIYLTSDVGVNVSLYVQTEVTIIDDDEYDDDEYDGDDDDDEGTYTLS